MTLTEQWKKGELDRGVYYIKEQGSYKTDEWHGDCWEDSWSENVEEVLAPVPSYEEWQAKNEENKNLYKMLDVLNRQLDSLLKEDKENQQLKELLNYIRDEIADMPATALQLGFGWISEAEYRIDKAIGEKK